MKVKDLVKLDPEMEIAISYPDMGYGDWRYTTNYEVMELDKAVVLYVEGGEEHVTEVIQ